MRGDKPMRGHNCHPAQAQKDFIAEVEEERKDRNMYKQELSMRAFGRPRAYQSLVSEKRNATIKTLEKLAKGLGMKLVVCLMEDE